MADKKYLVGINVDGDIISGNFNWDNSLSLLDITGNTSISGLLEIGGTIAQAFKIRKFTTDTDLTISDVNSPADAWVIGAGSIPLATSISLSDLDIDGAGDVAIPNTRWVKNYFGGSFDSKQDKLMTDFVVQTAYSTQNDDSAKTAIVQDGGVITLDSATVSTGFMLQIFNDRIIDIDLLVAVGDTVKGENISLAPGYFAYVLYLGVNDWAISVGGSSTGGGTSTFIGGTDTPANYIGSAGKAVAVASGENGVEFVDFQTTSVVVATKYVDYTTTLSENGNTILIKAGNNITLNSTGLSIGFNQIVFNDTDSEILIGTVDIIKGGSSLLSPGYYASYILIDIGTWALSAPYVTEGGGGVSDHALLTNIGSNTHVEIDNWIANSVSNDVTDEPTGAIPITKLIAVTQDQYDAGPINSGTHYDITDAPVGGDVSKVGTPVDNQIAIWTGDGTIEGSEYITFHGSGLQSSVLHVGSSTLTNPSIKFEFNGVNGDTNSNALSLDGNNINLKYKAQDVFTYIDGFALKSDINTTAKLDAESSTSKALITKEWAELQYSSLDNTQTFTQLNTFNKTGGGISTSSGFRVTHGGTVSADLTITAVNAPADGWVIGAGDIPLVTSVNLSSAEIDGAGDVAIPNVKWVNEAIAASGVSSPLTTKGDIFTFSTVNERLGVGIDGQILTADSAETTGLKWTTASGTGDMLLGTSQVNTANKTFLDTTLLLQNVANTFNGSFLNTNTANRVYTLKDSSGTLAFTTDITGTNSGTNTGDQDLTGLAPKNPTLRTISVTTDTLVLTDDSKYIRCTSASATTVTVPLNSSVAFAIGAQINIRQAGAGQVTIAATGGVTINTEETLLLKKQHSTVTLIKVATDEWDIMGSLTSA